jgi:rhodanese-related sulfurtransferase
LHQTIKTEEKMMILMMNIKSLILLAIVTIIAVSCAKIFSRGIKKPAMIGTYANVGVDEFQSLIANPAVQLLDVRSREEFDDGHIAGATLVDVNDTAFVENAMAVLDTQRQVAVYCRSGRRSARAASLLTARGYKVTNLDGGVIAWQDSGRTLVK